MPTERYLIFGGGFFSGVMSRHLEKKGHDVTVLDYPEIDITSLESVREALTKYRPNYLINAAAFTNTKQAELPENASKVFHTNVQGPANIQIACAEKDIPWLHISTGMMFDGQPPRPEGWNESDRPTPRGYYAWTKYWADQLLLPFADTNRILIFRIHTPISLRPNPLNLITKLTKFDSFVSDVCSMTILEDLCRAFDVLREARATGLYHIANPGAMSFLDIAKQLQEADLIPYEKDLGSQTFAELNAAGQASGAAYQPQVLLDTSKLVAAGVELPPIWERVGEIVDEMGNRE